MQSLFDAQAVLWVIKVCVSEIKIIVGEGGLF